ncbi:hypothetical protein MMC21_005367 [Puttea exsequens]|nr:hypothetical protein [Puttea exsequens]
MDENVAMEKRYSRRQGLPLYETKNDFKLDPHYPPPSGIRRGRSRRSILIYLTAIFLIFLILSWASPRLFAPLYNDPNLRIKIPQKALQPTDSAILTTPTNASLVPLEAHIMSKCPDAKTCLEELVVPAMEKVVDKVSFRLSYIGKIDSSDDVQCMHGAEECLGNMMGLCAQDLYPNNTKISLGFSTCLTMNYTRIPDRDLVEECSLEHGIPFEKLNACLSEEGKGLDLLEKSVLRSSGAGVKKSCTVRVAGEVWCIMDGGKWKECKEGHEVVDLVKAVESRYKAT